MNRSSTSPFRGTSVSMSRTAGYQSAELLIKSLEQQNNALVQEINVIKTKAKKVNELQDKIEMILRHNTQLLNQNQRLARLINQKKSQVQIWKNKHDNVNANKSTASDMEIKRLLNQIQKLKEESCEIEHVKNLQINQLKNQQNLQIQNMKRNNLGSSQKYQLEIRKHKQFCDKKEYQVADLKMKIARIGKETDFEIGKLRQQKQRLRNDLQFQQAQHRKQIQSLKSKFDYNFHSQIQNLKKQHLNQVQTLDYQNSKLKQVINSKNIELEQAMAKQSKMRNHYEDSIDILKKQNTDLKQKMVQNQHISDIQLANLRDKLESIKQSQLTLLKDSHNSQLNILNRQISKLHQFLQSRNSEIQIICKERNQMRSTLQAEILKSKAQSQAYLNENKQIISKYEENIKGLQANLKYKEQQMRISQNKFNSQIQVLGKEKKTAQNLLSNKDKQLERQRKESRETVTKLQGQVRTCHELVSQARDQLEKVVRRTSSDSDDQKKMSNLKEEQLAKRIIGLQDQIKQNLSEIKQLKSNIKLLEEQNKLNEQKIQLLQNTQKQLRNRSKQNFTKWDLKQKQLNRLIDQQITSMQKSKNSQIQQLKSIHDNKMRTLRHQIKQLERQVEDKNNLLNMLKKNYQQLLNNYEKIFAQEAARKNLDIKVPGWLPQTLALKSLFDVFLKNKVLEYCS